MMTSSEAPTNFLGIESEKPVSLFEGLKRKSGP